MNGVTFGTYHSYDDFSLILTSKEIAAPKTKTVKIDVDGADGAIDLTEFFGEPKYEDCTHKFQFSTIVPQNQFLSLFSDIKNKIHGKKLRISLDADPGFYYVGRCFVSAFTNEKNVGKISVECDCEPYKYKAQRTKQVVPFYGKNIFNPANTQQGVLNAGIGLTFAALTAFTTTTRLRSTSPFYAKPNTQYTFSFPNTTFKAAVRQFDKNNILVAGSAWVTSPYTFKTAVKAEKLALYIALSDDSTITPENIINEQFQLEEGSAATAFEAYNLTESTLSVFLNNSKKPTVPDIYSYDEVTITNGEETFVIKDGETKTFPEFELKEGSNQFNITGTGVVVFEWQEGAL